MTTLDTLRQLLADATPGPWEVTQDGLTHPEGWDVIGPAGQTVAIDPEGYTGSIGGTADARLIAAAPTHLADLITALEQIERVRVVHKPYDFDGTPVCDACDHPYPCPTIRILDGNE